VGDQAVQGHVAEAIEDVAAGRRPPLANADRPRNPLGFEAVDGDHEGPGRDRTRRLVRRIRVECRTMSDSRGRRVFAASVLLWTARLAGTAAVVPLMLIAFGEHGTGPSGARGWAYLALFPFGFSAGYLVGWRWPLLGGCVSLACMAMSLALIGRTFGVGPYLIWGSLSVPGILYVIAGLELRSARRGIAMRKPFPPPPPPGSVATDEQKAAN
jgi:hypothetical protein